jgi:hypothetical protein
MLQRSETVDEVFVAFGFKRGGYEQTLCLSSGIAVVNGVRPAALFNAGSSETVQPMVGQFLKALLARMRADAFETAKRAMKKLNS